ncbi:hypothetical protein QMG90_08990 [Trabulsiella odontotermitis]|uniref:hypothetical protein n=1 Tax=Trabulsiella odontotermitis TaxID=379893 RepID=UPI0024B837DC|nr:hypothetical protein [Trabulsiella odontotermitis]WHP33020.1 hypothetical protein QMG90_08990 [Trabulsiella odontotermitis]
MPPELITVTEIMATSSGVVFISDVFCPRDNVRVINMVSMQENAGSAGEKKVEQQDAQFLLDSFMRKHASYKQYRHPLSPRKKAGDEKRS